MKYLLIILILMLVASCLQATEIYGVIDEDTTIGPEGNPWYVTSSLWVEEEVTLTILPETEILITSANSNDYWNYCSTGSEPEAKAITVYGSIQAIGTESDSILFTRYPNVRNYRWGSIRIYSENPSESIFKHCIIEYSAFYNDGVSGLDGGIASYTGITIENCRFTDNYCSIVIFNYGFDIAQFPTLINSCTFNNTGDMFLYYSNFDHDESILICVSEGVEVMTQVSNNIFNDSKFSSINGRNDFVFNTFNHIRGIGLYNNQNFYGNYLENCTSSFNSIRCDTLTAGVFRKNHLEHIHLSGIDEYQDISANKFNFFTDLDFDVKPDSRFYNNTSENTGMTIYCNWDSAGTQNIYNNFMYESSLYYEGNGNCNYFNNIACGTDCTFGGWLDEPESECNCFNNYVDKWIITIEHYGPIGNINHYNNIYNDRENYVEEHFERESFNFYNNFLTYDIPEFVTDCGGNLEGMDISLAGVIIDTLNHSFALSDSSLCIDAGYEDTTFCNWDYSYNFSPFDGDGDGVAVVDIGPVEYGSYFTIGYVKCTVNDPGGAPLDIIRGEVAGECVEYTGQDGSFIMALAEGTYTLHLTSPFYEDDSVFIAVNVADTSYVNMTMEATYPFVEAEEDDLPEAEVISNVMAYPNPFNPEVTISFSTTIVRTRFDMAGGGTENTEVCIYNIKGQRLRSFKIQNSKFKINQVVWDGADERGRQVSTGVYLYQIRVGGYKHAGKVIMLK